MSVRFNHTIVHSQDPKQSASFLAGILGLPEPSSFGPFQLVELANGASLDFLDADGMEIQTQHYAFLIDENEFDQIFARVRERGLRYWADPHKSREGAINHNDGGRGFYFDDPDGHLMEVLTRPYGSGASSPKR